MSEFYGNNATPQFIHLNEITIANYTGVKINNLSGKWRAFPKLNDTIYVQTTNKRTGFSTHNLEGLAVCDLIPEKNVIICDKQGIELPVEFRFDTCSNDGFIAYFCEKEN